MDDEPSVCVVTHPLADASENVTRDLLTILSAITSVSLVTINLPSDSPIRDEYDVIEVSESDAGESILVSGMRFALNQLRMCRAIARRDEGVVLFFGATSYLLPIAVARAIGKTVVLEPRGDVPLTLRLQWEQRVPAAVARLLSGIVRTLERIGYRLSDGIVTYTPAMASELGLEAFEHKLHPNGARYVDVERFRPRTPFEERDRTVGYLGRLDEEKGIRELARAVPELPEGVTFRFIGDGDLRPWLERELSEEIEAGSAEVTGWVDHDEVPAELDHLRLLVMPSQPTEGLPTTILESLACGTPVYATPVSGVPDVVRDGETGFLMRTTDPDEIAADVASILDRDLERIGANGRALIESEYSFDAAVDRYREILEDL